jgi:hypothetical protein
MEADKAQASKQLGDLNEWEYLSQGGYHLAFRGMKEWKGYVLKLEKCKSKGKKDKQSDHGTLVPEKEDHLIEAANKCPVLAKYVPRSV